MRNLIRILLSSVASLTVLLSCDKGDIPVSGHTGKVVESIGDNVITDFVFDEDGYVWMMGSDSPYLFKTDSRNIIQYSYDSSDPGSLSSNKINDIILGSDGAIWLATQRGVDRYNRECGFFEHIELDEMNSYVVGICSSSDGRICIATRRTILELDSSTGTFTRKLDMPFVSSSDEPDIFFDSLGHLWVYFAGRLDCFDSGYSLMFSAEGITDNVVYDGIESIWLMQEHRPCIVNVSSMDMHPVSEDIPGIARYDISSFSLLKKGVILARGSQGLLCIDKARGTIMPLEETSSVMRMALSSTDALLSYMAVAPDGSLWMAPQAGGFRFFPMTAGAGISHESLVGTLQSDRMRSTFQDPVHYWSLLGDGLHCYDIADAVELGVIQVSQYYDGHMPYTFSVSQSGEVLLSGPPRSSYPFVIVGVDFAKRPYIRKVIPNPGDGLGVFGSGNGVYNAGRGARLFSIDADGRASLKASIFNDDASYASMVRTLFDGSVLVCYTDHCPVIYNPRRDEVKYLDIPGLKQAYFSTSVEDAVGNLWIGSTDNGLFVYEISSGEVHHVEGLQDMPIASLAADGEGNVYVMDNSSNVYLIDSPKSSPHRIWMDSSDYPPSRQLVTLPNKTVVLLWPTGCVPFNTEQVSESSRRRNAQSHVILTSGKKVLASFSTSSFPSHRATIRIKRNTDGLNLHIGAYEDITAGASYTYMYDINGLKNGPRESFDNAFIPLYGVTRPRNVVRFWMKDNNLGSETVPFTLVVKMNLLWFEVAIPLLFVLLLVASVILGVTFLGKKREADNERLKREMTEKMNMDNIDFFANISHEFRTPLTLIHAAVSTLGSGTQSDVSKARGVIKRSTDRLLKLVSQMLDFNKLDHGVLSLNVKQEQVSELFELIRMNFEIGASMKNIDLELHLPDSELRGWIDRDKVEKILYNLCSNAMKFTPPGGRVDIDVNEDEGHMLHVSVSDTGIGIPEEDLDAVFDRFYQTEATKKSGGTGIGLYYTRALVNLHHGSISVRVRKTDDGKTMGSVFSFSIPMSEKEYSDVEKSASTDKVVSIDRKEMMSEYIEEKTPSNDSDKMKLLIIDDDYEVVYYLKSLFSDNYNVSFRFDAMSGYKLIEEISPDVIISDVMMVDVDGIQLCRMVKDNLSMSHIPFIMLTAKSTMEDQIKSLGVGADAYVTKPFNSEYLQALVKSMLDNRARVREMLGSSTSVPTSSKDSLSYHDRALMEKMYAVMAENLQKGELDIDSVVEALGVSRSKFYYKVKALTGQTPNEFFTTYKLNCSVKLIKERKYKIAAIADMLGFSSASYFTSQFKKQFGVLPSQYSEEND